MLAEVLAAVRDGNISLGSRRTTTLIAGGTLFLICLMLFSGRLYSVSAGPSAVVGGIPGFYVIDNLWYHDKTFYLHDPSTLSTFPSEDEMLSGFTKLVIDHSPIFKPKPSTRLKGTTFFLNEGAQEGWNGLYHYYHFAAENILGGFAALGSVRAPTKPPPIYVEPERRTEESERKLVKDSEVGETFPSGDLVLPKRIIIPWEGGWRDKWGENELVINGIFPEMIDKDGFERMTRSGKWVLFDRVVLIDRWASHRHNPASDFWNKMAVPIFDHPHNPNFFNAVRQKLLSHYNIHPPAIASSIPRKKILYIDRQNSDRRLLKDDHEALVDLLSLLGLFLEVKIVELEDLGLREQVEMVSDCSVLIGIHGNGLTHEMWMPENATLIEIFPPGTFLRDYQSVAEVLNHPYYAIWNDTVLSRDQWGDKGEQQAGAIHDGREIPLHVPVLIPILEEILKK